ncbi:MAG: sulfur oxidation c-type cytochrome SoxX [Pseudomonadota bacterium]
MKSCLFWWLLLAGPALASPGDAARGRAIVADRQLGLCLLCHAAPIPEQRFQGNLGPDLAGAGKRWNADQLRQRVSDPASLNPATIMPAYAATVGLARVPAALSGQPILNHQQIEDVVAYLQSLE